MYWLFNTDETAPEGKDAYQLMLQQSCIAAWGKNYSADNLLGRPLPDDYVFFYVNKVGIVAKATFTTSVPFSSNSIFGKQKEGEFHRSVVGLVKPKNGPLSYTFVHAKTGYHLPAKGLALCRIHNSVSASKIERLF
jgi:hypothetical protein